jgi:GTP-binding protein EngB required for normal cell division
MVEFRAPIASVLDRAEDKTFEIAVFGRVSSGKSSLLNAILEAEILPVGVTPITAVPTRIAYGEKPWIKVSFAEAPARSLEVSALPEFATEQLNPGNAKRVTRIVVTLPAQRLGDGVSFVDTPGLGSLATSGAAETLAYLPKCDLGIVLVDAGSTLTAEDLRTVLMLQEAAIPINMLLSKADLLGTEDREKIIQYIGQHIASECGIDLLVHPVSVLSSHRDLLDRWFAEHILPLYSRSQELRVVSLRRKIGALRESVVAALQIDLRRDKTPESRSDVQIRATESRLRRAMGLIEEASSLCEKALGRMSTEYRQIFQEAAVDLMKASPKSEGAGVSIQGSVRDSIARVIEGEVKTTQGYLEALAAQLRDDLRRSAEELGIPDRPGDDEFQSVVRGTPLFDGGSLDAAVSRPFLGGLFGKRVAEARLANALQRELGETLRGSLETYSGILKEWTRVVTNQLLRRFETYAEAYRAQAERSVGKKALTDDETRSIQMSLALLEISVPRKRR